MNRKALLIGVSEYNESFSPLKCVEYDLDNLNRILGDEYLGAFDVQPLCVNPNRQVMETTISEFADSCQGDDTALFYFSGHGVKLISHDNNYELYFVTSNTRMKSDRKEIESTTALTAKSVYGLIKLCKAKSKVLILDCCYSGAFESTRKGASEIENNIFHQAQGTVVLTSSDAQKYSSANLDNMCMSAFTHYLVEGIETGAADRDLDGIISVDDIHDYITEKFRERRIGQNPKILIFKDKGYNIEIAKSPKTNEKSWIYDQQIGAIKTVQIKPNSNESSTEFPDIIRWLDGKVMLLIKPSRHEWFYVDKYPVTADQYSLYTKSQASVASYQSFWSRYRWNNAGEFPATDISVDDAKEYAQFFNKQLPILSQWCLAATGGVEPFTFYPWGDIFEENRCNSREYWQNNSEARPKFSAIPDPTSIYKFPAQNPTGICDIVGNILEISYCQKSNRWVQSGGSHENNCSDLQINLDSENITSFHQGTQNIGFRCTASLSDYSQATKGN
jgi:Caspase domain/Sulfatase-modifying factor enzyme 1